MAGYFRKRTPEGMNCDAESSESDSTWEDRFRKILRLSLFFDIRNCVPFVKTDTNSPFLTIHHIFLSSQSGPLPLGISDFFRPRDRNGPLKTRQQKAASRLLQPRKFFHLQGQHQTDELCKLCRKSNKTNYLYILRASLGIAFCKPERIRVAI